MPNFEVITMEQLFKSFSRSTKLFIDKFAMSNSVRPSFPSGGRIEKSLHNAISIYQGIICSWQAHGERDATEALHCRKFLVFLFDSLGHHSFHFSNDFSLIHLSQFWLDYAWSRKGFNSKTLPAEKRFRHFSLFWLPRKRPLCANFVWFDLFYIRNNFVLNMPFHTVSFCVADEDVTKAESLYSKRLVVWLIDLIIYNKYPYTLFVVHSIFKPYISIFPYVTHLVNFTIALLLNTVVFVETLSSNEECHNDLLQAMEPV